MTEKQPNILFLVIDSLSKQKILDKNKNSETPGLDFLVEQGTSFSNAIAPSPSSYPSIASILTGIFPFKSIVLDNKHFRINPKTVTFIKNLIDYNYNAYATIPEGLSYVGLDQIFGKNLETYNTFSNLHNGYGNKIIKNFEQIKDPWVYYIHIEDLHGQAMFHNENETKKISEFNGNNNYEKMLSYIDLWIKKIIDKINFNETLVIVTADHSSYSAFFDKNIENLTKKNSKIKEYESSKIFDLGKKISHKSPKIFSPLRKTFSKKFIERKNKEIKLRIQPQIDELENSNLNPFKKRIMQHAIYGEASIFDEMLQVPIIFCGLNIKKNILINNLVRTIDIFPTIIEIIGMPNYKTDIHGVSLCDLINNKTTIENPAIIQSCTNSPDTENSRTVGVRTSKFKYFRDWNDSEKNIHLYDIIDDPFEEENIHLENKDIILNFEKILKDYRSDGIFENINSEEKITDEKAKKISDSLRKQGYIN